MKELIHRVDEENVLQYVTDSNSKYRAHASQFKRQTVMKIK